MVVFTRGVISDIQDVTDEIVRASHYPLSIIIVGVGKNNDTKFDKLRNLDGEDTEEEWVEDDDGNKKSVVKEKRAIVDRNGNPALRDVV